MVSSATLDSSCDLITIPGWVREPATRNGRLEQSALSLRESPGRGWKLSSLNSHPEGTLARKALYLERLNPPVHSASPDLCLKGAHVATRNSGAWDSRRPLALSGLLNTIFQRSHHRSSEVSSPLTLRDLLTTDPQRSPR